MKALGIAFCLLFLAACRTELNETAIPETPDVQQVENLLSKHPCVGDLDGWERSYRYSRKTGLFSDYSFSPDFDVIEFHLRRAGDTTIAAGRNILTPSPGGGWPDSNRIISINGKFVLGSRSLRLSRCTPVAKSESG